MKNLLLLVAVVALICSCQKASCTDGKKNGGEEQTDCGGSCTPCCNYNGIQDGVEEGIDCGANCDPCTDPPYDMAQELAGTWWMDSVYNGSLSQMYYMADPELFKVELTNLKVYENSTPVFYYCYGELTTSHYPDTNTWKITPETYSTKLNQYDVWPTPFNDPQNFFIQMAGSYMTYYYSRH
jgi:hypothetical protein